MADNSLRRRNKIKEAGATETEVKDEMVAPEDEAGATETEVKDEMPNAGAVAPEDAVEEAVEDEMPNAIKLVTEAPPLAEGEAKVTMMFPADVNILEGGIMHRFKKGRQEIPKRLKDHWYLKKCGVLEV